MERPQLEAEVDAFQSRLLLILFQGIIAVMISGSWSALLCVCTDSWSPATANKRFKRFLLFWVRLTHVGLKPGRLAQLSGRLLRFYRSDTKTSR